MATKSKHQESRSSETVKRTSAIPFVENPIGQKFTVVYIAKGIKHVRCGSIHRSFSGGDALCMAVGTFEIENIPDDKGCYEEIAAGYSAAELQSIIARLHLLHDIPIAGTANVKGLKRFCGCRAGRTTASVFDEIGHDIDCGTADKHLATRKSDLIYSLITHADEDMVNCILDNMDPEKEFFIKMVYGNIFTNRTLKELAEKCNCSLSKFKDICKKYFHASPHRWITEQRIKRACFLLLTTDRSIESIGDECVYANELHFIKEFKKRRQMTPMQYRRKMRVRVVVEQE